MIVKACTIDEIGPLMTEYLEGLSSPFDSFLEAHILESEFYLFRNDSNDIGYMAVHQRERLTQFYVRRAYLKHAQPLFRQVIDQYAIQSLFVPTCDELLLSLAIDQDYAIRKQAYFFQDSQVDVPEVRDNEGDRFRLATPDDLPAIQHVCGDFLDNYARWIETGELLVYYRNEELLGIGLAESSRLFTGLASIGMFTNEAYRNQGVGKAMIVRLRDWCRKRDIRPIGGCWYYNEASKRTLESGGMVTRTRLLHVEVKKTGAEA
ncbi:GNAT superfamily N-acetyltransferase [Paenibacillus phyllosphaerae]|uniref:GNAT superfamily N-acetyltransferase n=1 Tax=Paenibacillus phyllosphaerae TaxID=274593 RepID=A0A7W5FQ49_9BACL|nr:GNAT family N-acetyltransferase [Paenibacillus phyllosphaerae]MBB3112857.1 GNAT superfamily N-acetyltransferase [Paenibacillus phyllosphaerae]